jgi:8-oxo-dGTP pyrophosphatase MutT (NUDIX family)
VLYQHDERGKPQYLLIKKRGGYWTLPKGKLNPNEDEIDALIREVAEETGLEGVVEQPIHAVSYKILKQGQLIRKHVNYYLVRITGGKLVLSAAEKIIKAGWFPSTTAIRRLRRGRLRVIFRRAHLLLHPLKP